MTLEWKIDGPALSMLFDLESPETIVIGTVMKNPDGTWTAYDNTKSNDIGTTSLPLATKPTRDEAKQAVEESFRTPTREGPKCPLKADFTSNPWALAVERRWNEVTDLLEKHTRSEVVFASQQLLAFMAELNSLYTVTQYAGSNARTAWVMAMTSYRNNLFPDG